MDHPPNLRVLVTAPGLDNVKLTTGDPPVPAEGEALVRIDTAGVTYADIMDITAGSSRRRATYPFVPGHDCVGRIVSFGPGAEALAAASGLKVGDQVALYTRSGGFQQFLCWRASDLVKVPEGVDPAEAACTVLNYTTAYCLLNRAAAGLVKAGASILIHSAAGGLGTALVHLAKLAGAAHVYGTCSAGKMAHVARQDAVPIDYRHEDFVERVLEMTRGRGVDVVFDAVGGAHVQRSYRCLTRNGRLVCYGFTGAESEARSGAWDSFLTRASIAAYQARFWSSRSAIFYAVDAFKKLRPADFRTDLATVLGLLAARRLHPIVHDRVALADAVVALKQVQRMEQIGKIVLMCSAELVAAEEARGRLQTAASLLQRPPDIKIPEN